MLTALHEATGPDSLLLSSLPLALLEKTLREPLDTAEVNKEQDLGTMQKVMSGEKHFRHI